MSGWDEKFMGLARHIATWSKDSGRHIGAIVVGPDNEIRSTGFNGIPRGVRDDVAERHDKESGEKYIWGAHAERNAIYNAARVGIPLKGCRIYSTVFPCVDCVIALIQSGICEIVTVKADLENPQWGAGYKRALRMLEEAKIKIRYMEE